jgi:hypothetical protein
VTWVIPFLKSSEEEQQLSIRMALDQFTREKELEGHVFLLPSLHECVLHFWNNGTNIRDAMQMLAYGSVLPIRTSRALWKQHGTKIKIASSSTVFRRNTCTRPKM